MKFFLAGQVALGLDFFEADLTQPVRDLPREIARKHFGISLLVVHLRRGRSGLRLRVGRRPAGSLLLPYASPFAQQARAFDQQAAFGR
ncbi:MAG: hypothetical protein H0U43_07515 [Chthoniobacterales bacterium]|nr:hypothetical protein [Chthoniobacterales bacterium]